MEILFTSVGRRGYLLRYFKEAMKGAGSIHAANSDGNAPAFLAADHTVVTPLIHDPGYIDHLLDYCRTWSIDALIPLFDVDIAMLAANRDRFQALGVTLVCSDEPVAAICNDKWKTFEFLRSNGFDTPDTYLDLAEAELAIEQGRLAWPVVVKPRWGMGSIGVYMAEDMDELRLFHAKVRRQVFGSYLKYESAADSDRCVIIQQRSPGVEHGLDVVNDLQARHITTFVKRKLAMRSGETDSAMTVDEPLLRDLGGRLAGALGHRANLDVDVFLDGGTAYVLELNARFGGGYPFSHLAGADLPGAILQWLEGRNADEDHFRIQFGVQGMKDIQPVRWQKA